MNKDVIDALMVAAGCLLYSVLATIAAVIGMVSILKKEQMTEENCKNCKYRIYQNGYLYCGLTAENKDRESICENYRKEEK